MSAIVVQMSEDIKAYEVKTIGPFTTRQVVCLMIGGVVGIGVAYLVPVEILYKILIATLIICPSFMCGSTKISGTYLEVILLRIIYKKFLTPPKRKMKTVSSYKVGLQEYEQKVLDYQLSKLPEKKRKAYLKKKSQKKQIHYSKKRENKVYI